MEQKITLHKINLFLEGNSQRLLEELKLQPQHIREQIAYRRLICSSDCAKTGECIICGCEFKGRTSTVESCNPERFGDLVSKREWETYKEENGIR